MMCLKESTGKARSLVASGSVADTFFFVFGGASEWPQIEGLMFACEFVFSGLSRFLGIPSSVFFIRSISYCKRCLIIIFICTVGMYSGVCSFVDREIYSVGYPTAYECVDFHLKLLEAKPRLRFTSQ